jgi:hypothetical protein
LHLGRYIRWNPSFETNPSIELAGRWDIEALHDDHEGFRLILRLEPYSNRRWRFWFREALLYESTSESFRLSGSSERKQEPSQPHHHFFTVEDSSLLADFHRSSCGIYRDWPIKHYAIYSETCVDVLSKEPPVIDELPADRPVA